MASCEYFICIGAKNFTMKGAMMKAETARQQQLNAAGDGCQIENFFSR